jgi:hypothetical protein
VSLPPALRRMMLAVHVICSVGWIGAAAAYLALGLAAQFSRRGDLVRAAWLAMELTGWYVIVPLGCLALLTGLVMAHRFPVDQLRAVDPHPAHAVGDGLGPAGRAGR